MKILFFWNDKCPNCHLAQKVLDNLNVNYKALDTDSVDGMTEAAFYSVIGAPTILLLDNDDFVVKAWFSEIPDQEDLKKAIDVVKVLIE